MVFRTKNTSNIVEIIGVFAYKTAVESIEFIAKVKSLSFKGLGVVDHPNGKVYFVKGAWPGDVIQLKILRSEKTYGFAEIVKILENSEERVVASCAHQGFRVGECGGCPWMIGSYTSQLDMKETLFKTQLQRAKIVSEDFKFSKIQPSPKNLKYRNRAQFKTDGHRLGYISPESHVLVDIVECPVLTDSVHEKFQLARSRLPEDSWVPRAQYPWNFLELDENVKTLEINSKRPFQQANSEQNEFMKNWLSAKIKNLPTSWTALELFCGSGNFTQILSQKFNKIVAIESVLSAVQALEEKLFQNVFPRECNLFDSKDWKKIFLKSEFSASSSRLLVLDPPREGFEAIASFISYLKELEKIIYISCDATTFIRDSKALKTMGFSLQEVQLVDAFPHTPHLEVLSVFTRKVQ